MSFLLNPYIYAAAGPSCSYISDTNLVSHWPLDGDSGDDVGAFDGTDSNVTYPSDTTPYFGTQAWSGNGSTSYTDFGNDVASLQSSVFSVGAWFKTDTLNAYQQIIDNYGATSLGPYRIMIDNSSNRMLFSIGANNIWTSSNAISADTWHHVVLTKTNTSTAKFYIDGTEYNFGSNTTKTSTNSKMVIGARWNQTGGVYDSHWGGVVDDLFYFDRVLTAAEVTEIWSGGSTGCRVSNP